MCCRLNWSLAGDNSSQGTHISGSNFDRSVTNLTDLVRVDCKESSHIVHKLAQSWLIRYPWSQNCIHDNSGKFTGYDFQKLLVKSNITDVPTTSHNPMANVVCEVCIRLLRMV